MKPPAFEYERAGSVDDALELLARHGDEAKLIAGGQSLLPLLNFRVAKPERLIDIGRLDELSYIEASTDTLRIGAMTRTADVQRSAVVAERVPLLAEAASYIAHPQIRNRGTVGGSIAHADPAAELPTVMVALDGTVVVRSAEGEREVAAADFFLGVYTTVLEPEEMVVELRIPILPGTSAFEEFSRRSGDFAIGAVACHLSEAGPVPIRLAAIGLSGRAVRLLGAERSLAGSGIEPGDVSVAVGVEVEREHPGADPFARRVVVELAERAYVRAKDRQLNGGSDGA